MKKPKITAMLLVLLSSFAAAIPSLGCGAARYSGPPQSVSIGIMPGIQATLIYIADREGFFTDNGLDVEIRDYPLGVDALKGAASGEVDFGLVAEFGYVAASFSQPDVQVVASIAELNDADLVGRKDLGVGSAADLKGKRFGTKAGTQFHYLLGKYLQLHGLSLADVTIVTTNNPEESRGTLIDGSTDATILMEPYATTVKGELGANAFVDDVQVGQRYYWPLVSRRQYIDGHEEAVRRLLGALVDAEEFVEDHPSEARTDVAEETATKPSYIGSVWPECRFRVTLPQSLIVSMEDEAGWAVANGLFAATSVPNYLDRIYADGLERVAPDNVTVY